ncbi:MAG: hypothetical protein AAF551_10475 [Bacteroidota bacterium]
MDKAISATVSFFYNIWIHESICIKEVPNGSINLGATGLGVTGLGVT